MFGTTQAGVTAQDVATLIATEKFRVASDGAADPLTGRASFGWLLTDQAGKILVKCSGPVFGRNPSSYRAEAYGILSPMRLIKHLQTFFKLPTVQPYKHYCDNKSVIVHCKNARSPPLLHPIIPWQQIGMSSNRSEIPLVPVPIHQP
jgi:hypothetical protein